ncbi:GNAT family N-acetyltransferase [Haloimpatiens sp. FM7330]|uniref:GNAT family N-acetyltransferase n=1 Tax=Haloimpatiens sp. FM7330 TaxID=3298610 RepID=UPI00363C78AB
MYRGEKILLRAYKKEDIPLAWKYINDEEVKRYLTPGIPFPLTLEEEYKWFEGISSSSNNSYSFAIETLQEGKYIGGCGVNRVDWKNSIADIGIFIGNGEFREKGYGTDAVKALIKFIFNEMNLNKIKLNVYSFNKRAIKCYEKCGFKVEGTLRQEIFREGKYHDEYIMSILRCEYNS